MGQGRGQSPTSPKRIEGVERQAKALELRKAGATYEEIGKKLKVSMQAAHKAVKKALQTTLREPAMELREVEFERYQTMLRSIWMEVLKGNLPAIDRALKISERIAVLMGLNAPQKLEHSGPDGGPIEERVIHKPITEPEKLNRIAKVLADAGIAQLPEAGRRFTSEQDAN